MAGGFGECEDDDDDEFSTHASIIDTAHAHELGDVGRSDGSCRCVTFAADSDRFYATASVGSDSG